MAFTSSKSLFVPALSLTLLTTSAHATLFSFASDDDSTQFTFRGTAASGSNFGIVNGRDPMGTPVTLKIDDNNGGNPTVSLNVNFRANFSAFFVNSVGLAGAQTFVYGVSGSFSFVDPSTGAALLTGTLGANQPASLTILGSTTAWGTSGSIFSSDTAYNFAGSVVWTSTPGLAAAISAASQNPLNYGVPLAGGTSGTPDDFSFTLTNLNSGGGAVPINSTSRLPTTAWASEGSFSGSALNGIPTPGALSLIGVAGLLVLGRRRR